MGAVAVRRRRTPVALVPGARGLALGVGVILLAGVVGLTIARGRGLSAAVAAGVLAFSLAGIRDWRSAVIGMLAFLPFSGLLVIAAYPDHAGLATLAKDFFFVIPAYLGFISVYLHRRGEAHVWGFPVGLAVLFAAIAVLQVGNPSLPNIATGLTGLKVWIFYLPMVFLGYHMVRSIRDLERLFRLVCLVSIPSLVIGIAEGILVNTGHASTVYSWYGDAAGAVTQDFGDFGVPGSSSIRRVSSTFSFVAQYYYFTILAFVVSFAYWRALARTSSDRLLGSAVFFLAALASMLSGARAAIVAVPALALVMLMLDRKRMSGSGIALPVAIVTGLAAAAAVFGTTVSGLVTQVLDHAWFELSLNTVEGFQDALGRTFFGLGTGVDTRAARYVLPAFDPYELVGGRVAESWWVKAFLELGAVGLVVLVAFMASLTRRALAIRRRLVDPALRSVATAVLALLFFAIVTSFKGSVLDIDPLNVVLWLLVGILFKLPTLDPSAMSPNGVSSAEARLGPQARPETASSSTASN